MLYIQNEATMNFIQKPMKEHTTKKTYTYKKLLHENYYV